MNTKCLYAVAFLCLICFSFASVFAEQRLSIKYRDSKVDVDKPYFEYLDTTKSSIVKGAWYDQAKQYLIINLNGS